MLQLSSPTRPKAKGQRLTSSREPHHLNTNSMVVSSSSVYSQPPLSPLQTNASTLITAVQQMHKPTESGASQNVQPTDHGSPKMRRPTPPSSEKCATCLPLILITPIYVLHLRGVACTHQTREGGASPARLASDITPFNRPSGA